MSRPRGTMAKRKFELRSDGTLTVRKEVGDPRGNGSEKCNVRMYRDKADARYVAEGDVCLATGIRRFRFPAVPYVATDDFDQVDFDGEPFDHEGDEVQVCALGFAELLVVTV